MLMKTFKSLQGQSLGFHFLFFSLNPARDSIAFISGGSNSQMLSPTQTRIPYKHCKFDVP